MPNIFFPFNGKSIEYLPFWLAKRAPRKCAQPNNPQKCQNIREYYVFQRKLYLFFKLFKKNYNRQPPKMVLPSVMIRPLLATRDPRHLNFVSSQPRTNNCNNPTPRGGMGGLSMDFPYWEKILFHSVQTEFFPFNGKSIEYLPTSPTVSQGGGRQLMVESQTMIQNIRT